MDAETKKKVDRLLKSLGEIYPDLCVVGCHAKGDGNFEVVNHVVGNVFSERGLPQMISDRMDIAQQDRLEKQREEDEAEKLWQP